MGEGGPVDSLMSGSLDATILSGCLWNLFLFCGDLRKKCKMTAYDVSSSSHPAIWVNRFEPYLFVRTSFLS